jgi:xylulokinase
MAGLVAGVDCSTQSTKVLVVDPDDGRVVASGRADHVVTGERGARETDPRVWWSALTSSLAATGRARDVGAIAIGGQQHGLVVLDVDGSPLRDSMLWNDTRSSPQAEALLEAFGEGFWADRLGLRPVASFTVTKWAWLRQTEPDLARATSSIRLPHDYLTERLTDRGVTDRGDASGTGWWSGTTGGYESKVLGHPLVELEEAMLPAVLGPIEAAGEVQAEVAESLGLGTGVMVGPGTGDNAAAALGLGLEAGQPVVSLGTSGTAYAVSDRQAHDRTGTVAGFADATGRFLPLAATLNCTLAVDRVAALLRLDRDDVGPSGEVVFLPYLDGERTPNLPHASGTLVGVRHETRPQQILMAAYEGAALSLLDAIDAIDAHSTGIDPAAPLILIGGGARGATWREAFGRLSGRPLLIPDADELVARGAAIQATAVWRSEDPLAVARRWNTQAGQRRDPVARDGDRLAQMRAVRDAIRAEPALSERAR